jgi:hypothetical protein
LRSSRWYLRAQQPRAHLLRSSSKRTLTSTMKKKDDEEYSPLSDIEVKKMYRDAEEVEAFWVEALVPTSRLHALVVHLGITSAPRYSIKELLRPG